MGRHELPVDLAASVDDGPYGILWSDSARPTSCSPSAPQHTSSYHSTHIPTSSCDTSLPSGPSLSSLPFSTPLSERRLRLGVCVCEHLSRRFLHSMCNLINSLRVEHRVQAGGRSQMGGLRPMKTPPTWVKTYLRFSNLVFNQALKC